MTEEATHALQQHRGYLLGLAYRLLGEVAEAEDVLQDAYLRWHGTERAAIDNARAYLSTVVTRLCLDRLKEARRRRETYIGAWLPEPLLEDLPLTAASATDVAEDVSFALMLALERLSPLERAAFLLHDVFDMGFEEIAVVLGRSAVACRQLASRARANVRAARPRFPVTPEEGARLANAFFEASRSGDTATLQTLLAEAATFHSDGGGRKLAALRPIVGADKLCRLFAGLARKAKGARPLWRCATTVNGLPGFVTVEHDGTLQTTALEIAGARIVAIYVMRNPDKLTHVLPLLPDSVRAAVNSGRGATATAG